MTIPYLLLRHHLSRRPNDYVARVQPRGAMDLDDVIDCMIQLAGATRSRSEVIGTSEDLLGAIEYLLLQGFNVNTPLANFCLTIKGAFDTDEDRFDSERHHVEPSISPGKRLRQSIREQAQVERKAPRSLLPLPRTYHDVNSGTRNRLLTPGGMGLLSGQVLSFDPADPAQGVFFQDATGQAFRVETVGCNSPNKLSFLVPELAPGDYRLELRVPLDKDGEIQRIYLRQTTLTVLPGGEPDSGEPAAASSGDRPAGRAEGGSPEASLGDEQGELPPEIGP